MHRLVYTAYVGVMGLLIVAAASLFVVASASLGAQIVRLLLP